MRRRNRQQSASADPGWSVKVVGAAVKTGEYYDYDRSGRHRRVKVDHIALVSHMVAVRLYFNGRERMTYGTLSISDCDFDDKITTMKAEAEDKASSLDAVGAT